MEQGNSIVNSENLTSSIFSNSDSVTENTGYQIRTDNNNNLSLEENERIRDKNTILNGLRYHLTRNQGNLTITQDSSVQVETPSVFNQVYAIRGQGNQFTLTRTPALTEYVFETDDLRHFAAFNVFEARSSRMVHVVNTSGQLIKFGLLHVDLSTSEGRINRQYRFNVIINDEDQEFITINPDNSVGNSSSRTVDVENLNLFVSSGDTLGIRYQRDGGSNVGNYCQVRLTVDTNARRSNFGETHIP